MQIKESLLPILNTLPTKSGCYMMKDNFGKIIYVGKAINLRSRVRSYFHNINKLSPRIYKLVQNIADIEWIVVDSELEALILEMNLIKKHRPHFNVRLKDDKRYPYIKVHWADDFPKVTISRQMLNDGSRYFGPYTSIWALHQTLDLLRKVYPYLTCDRVITGEDERACLYYDIKLCTAPCIGAISRENYRRMIDDLCGFLIGQTDNIVNHLKIEMGKAAQDLDFEHAATLRDQLQAIESIVEKQKIISSDYIDSDVLALARTDNAACVQVFFIRNGKLIGREYFLLDGTEGNSDTTVLTQFIKQFYNQAPIIPKQVLLPHEIEEAKVISQWLNQKRSGDKVELIIPIQGQQKELIDLATSNAVETLSALQAQWQADRHKQEQVLLELQEFLKIQSPINRIECYDISNIQGTASIGSMVVFEQGIPKKNLYRIFNIRTIKGVDDFASIEEVLDRRFNKWRSTQSLENNLGKKPDPAFSILPNLLIVDGGKGQLSKAIKILDKYDLLENFLVVALAKGKEELYIPTQEKPILLPRHSQVMFLFQRIRDEAHRVAITSHRKQRMKRGIASQLDTIPGIGPARRKELITHFGSIEKIREASIEEITALKGINHNLAEMIKANLPI